MQINRYWICDSSGSGRGVWNYFIGEFSEFETARDCIYHEFEPWAAHSNHYIDIELNVEPTMGFLIAEHKRAMNKVTQYQKIANHLANKIHEAERNA